MDEHSASIVELARHRRAVVLEQAFGAELRVLEGTVWLTQYGDDRDVVLGPGGRHRLERAGTALLGALGGSARVEIVRGASPQAAGSLAARLLGWLDPRSGGRAAAALAARS